MSVVTEMRTELKGALKPADWQLKFQSKELFHNKSYHHSNDHTIFDGFVKKSSYQD